MWWVDLQVDGVRRGSLSQTPRGRLPGPSTVIASSHTSPIDVLYLAAIFDPVFTQSYKGTKLVRPVNLFVAIWNCFSVPSMTPPDAGLVTLSSLVKQNPGQAIAVFPEATTSNGRGILKFATGLLSADKESKIFPVSLRYTPADITTPIPGFWESVRFVWRLNSRPTHCIRVRIGIPATTAAPIFPSAPTTSPGKSPSNRNSQLGAAQRRRSYEANFFDTLDAAGDQKVIAIDSEGEDDRTLDAVADSLARLGRVKRVDLGLEEKVNFVEAWSKGRKRR